MLLVCSLCVQDRAAGGRQALPGADETDGRMIMARMVETVAVAVSCGCCGGSHIEFLGEPRDEAAVFCAECGTALGDWSEVKEQARAAVADALREDFQNVLVDALARRRARLGGPDEARLAA
jgi:hypothetical protein